ncbi:V-type ATP synthase subunit E [Evtepia sp.]
MNGIEKLTGRIHQEAQEATEARLAQARAQAEEILANYAAQAAREKEEILAKGRQALAEYRERLASTAHLEERKQGLAARQQVMEEAFQKALATLCALPEGEAISLLARLAAAASETGEEAVLLSPAQRDTLGEQVVTQANALLPKGKLTLGPAAPEISGGLILRQGAVDINCSFAMLLRQQRAQLNGPVAALLFPEDGAH